MVAPCIKVLFFCLLQAGCLQAVQESGVKNVQPNNKAKAPILWTVDWSRDDAYVAVGGDDGILRIYDGEAFRLVKSYKLNAAVQCLDWNAKTNLLAIALDDNPVQLFDLEKDQFTRLPLTTGSRALAWNPAGTMLAVGDYDGSLQLWDKHGKQLTAFKKDNSKTVLSVDWHPTKNVLLTGSDKIRLFDTSGLVLQSIKHRKEETIILAVKWHPSGKFFASGDYGHNEEAIESVLQFWSEKGTLLKTIHGSKAEYRTIRWNKRGQWLATASDALRIWSADGHLLSTGKSDDLLWGLDWDANSKNVLTSSEKSVINLWTNKAVLVKRIH